MHTASPQPPLPPPPSSPQPALDNPTLDALRPHFAGRKVILAVGVVAAAPAWLALLRSLGTQKPLMLAEGLGTGPLPSPDDLDWVIVCDGAARDIVDGLRRYERALRSPPPEARARVEAYDPDRSARVITHFVHDGGLVAGRRPFGGRRPQDVALEDKTIIDALWDQCGVPRAPSQVVPLSDLDGLRAAVDALDTGHGTVWAGDARDGFHGGAVLTRRVLPATHPDYSASARAALDALRPRCDAARVMPFLEGVPCSVHGLVLHDRVLAFRPVEMVTLRGPSGFVYAGCASLWDPPPRDRDAMRASARAVGAHLRDIYGYRGVFTMDGVHTAQGFLPTELNPRLGVGLTTLLTGFDLLPLPLLNLTLREVGGLPLPWDALEAEALAHADANRAGGAWVTVPNAPPEPLPEPVPLRLKPAEGGRASAYEVAAPTEAGEAAPDGWLRFGLSPTGGFVRFQPVHATLPRGASLAPYAAAAFGVAARVWGIPSLRDLAWAAPNISP